MLTQQQRYEGLPADLVHTTSQLQKAMQRDDLGKAARLLARLTARVAGHPEVLRLQGTYEFARGDIGGALEALAQSVRLRPRDALTYHHLGNCYRKLGDNERAITAFQCACNEDPRQAEYWFSFGCALVLAGWNAHAIAVFQQAINLEPDHDRTRAMLALSLNMEGRGDEAAAQYRRILADHPESALSWWGLAMLKPIPLGPDDVQAMRAVLAGDKVRDYDRAVIHFAIAHAVEAQGDFVGAFVNLRQAHEIAAKGHPPWNGEANRAVLQRTLDVFATPHPAKPEDLGSEVIFIVSLPRSGSTLVEQIFASHSQVTGTAELSDMPQVIGDTTIKLGKSLPDWAPSFDASQWRALGQTYLERTARWRKEKPRFTDKMPANWRHLGAILTMLPNARVVVVRRDPLETCFACYRMFLAGLEYAHRFEGLAEYWRQFDHAIDIWQSRYPDRMRVQSYEALTADPDTEIRALLDFCDLPFEQGCIDFHTTKRRVTTPSAAQVRQPMRRDTARTDKYGTLLDPLREALGLPHFADVDDA